MSRPEKGIRTYAIATTFPSLGEKAALTISPASASRRWLRSGLRTSSIRSPAVPAYVDQRPAARSHSGWRRPLIETHGLQLPGFLDQIAFRNFFAIARTAVFDAHGTGVFGDGFRDARRRERRDQAILLGGGNSAGPPAPVESTRATIRSPHRVHAWALPRIAAPAPATLLSLGSFHGDSGTPSGLILRRPSSAMM